jgi:hypothetical protein
MSRWSTLHLEERAQVIPAGLHVRQCPLQRSPLPEMQICGKVRMDARRAELIYAVPNRR